MESLPCKFSCSMLFLIDKETGATCELLCLEENECLNYSLVEMFMSAAVPAEHARWGWSYPASPAPWCPALPCSCMCCHWAQSLHCEKAHSCSCAGFVCFSFYYFLSCNAEAKCCKRSRRLALRAALRWLLLGQCKCACRGGQVLPTEQMLHPKDGFSLRCCL